MANLSQSLPFIYYRAIVSSRPHIMYPVSFPYWSCVSCVFPPYRLSFLCVHVWCPQLILQNCLFFSACHFGSSLQELSIFLLTIPCLPSQHSKQLGEHTFLRRREIWLKSHPVFLQPCILGGLRGRTKSIDSPPPGEKKSREFANQSCLANRCLEKVWIVLLFH